MHSDVVCLVHALADSLLSVADPVSLPNEEKLAAPG